MAYMKTPEQMVNRVLLEAHRKGDTGTGTTRDLQQMVRNEYFSWFTDLAKSSWSGLGKAYRSLTVTTDSDTLDLPVEFKSMSAWKRDDQPWHGISPVRTTAAKALLCGWVEGKNLPVGSQGVYFTEGPGPVFDEGTQQLVDIPQRIRAFPPFSAGATVLLAYTTQPSDLGDASNPADDTIAVDVLAEPCFAAICARARIVYTGRGDGDEYRRAVAMSIEKAREVDEQRDTQDLHRPISIEAFNRPGGSSGYGFGNLGGWR